MLKNILALSFALILMTSCTTPATLAQARTTVADYNGLLGLTAQQEKQMINVEKQYIQDTAAARMPLPAADKSRKEKAAAILSRSQYVKWDIYINRRIKKLPVHL